MTTFGVRRSGLVFAALVVVVVGLVLLLTRTPQPPEGASRLGLQTQPGPVLPGFGCAGGRLHPIRVEDVGGVAQFRVHETNEVVNLVWPSGYAAWTVGDLAVLVNPEGRAILSEGEVITNLGGSQADDERIFICIWMGWNPQLAEPGAS